MGTTYLLPLLMITALLPFEVLGALIPLSKAKVVANNGVTYIGSLNNLNPATGIYRKSDYFLSPTTASWEEAGKDCKTWLGADGSLVNFQTVAELTEFILWHESNPGTESEYWTGGHWVTDATNYGWLDGTLVGSWLPWDLGEPATSLPVSKILLRTSGYKFAVEFESLALRYICERERD